MGNWKLVYQEIFILNHVKNKSVFQGVTDNKHSAKVGVLDSIKRSFQKKTFHEIKSITKLK